ncbi:MAG: NifB/NifX family molybdenum-iron cluster-binding protein [Mobilitalea sp.]
MHNNLTPYLNYSGKTAGRHPCFNNYDFHDAIIHLPVAPKQNINYIDDVMKSHCLAGSCERVSDHVLSAKEAMECYFEAKKSIPNLMVAAISGPEEVLADFDTAKETFAALRQVSPDISLCLSTNGLMLPVYASHLISLGVNYVTVNMNTIYPETGSRIYKDITYLGRRYSGVEGANILIQNQISGISYLASRGISVRVNVRVLPEINEDEINDVVEMAKECGCMLTNILPANNSIRYEANGLEAYSKGELSVIRQECNKILPQSYFCKPCRAASVETMGTIFSMNCEEYTDTDKMDLVPYASKLRFAICSKNGTLTDQHFGHATKFHIYDYNNGEINFMETRSIDQYTAGTKQDKVAGRIYRLIKTIEDCNCVICMRIGICPSDALKEKNIEVYTTYHLIEDSIREAVSRIYSGHPRGI